MFQRRIIRGKFILQQFQYRHRPLTVAHQKKRTAVVPVCQVVTERPADIFQPRLHRGEILRRSGEAAQRPVQLRLPVVRCEDVELPPEHHRVFSGDQFAAPAQLRHRDVHHRMRRIDENGRVDVEHIHRKRGWIFRQRHRPALRFRIVGFDCCLYGTHLRRGFRENRTPGGTP